VLATFYIKNRKRRLNWTLVLVAVLVLHATDLYRVLRDVQDTHCEEVQPLLLVRVDARNPGVNISPTTE
jgi:hypothetical protein